MKFTTISKSVLLLLSTSSFLTSTVATTTNDVTVTGDLHNNNMIESATENNNSYDWITCDEFLDHSARINKVFGLQDPRRVMGYTHVACKNILRAAIHADVVDDIVNIGTFLLENKHTKGSVKDFLSDHKDTSVPDEAAYRRRLDGKFGKDTCESDNNKQGEPGTHSNATGIPFCSDVITPAGDARLPCIPEWLQTNNTQAFQSFQTAYASGGKVDRYRKSAESVWNGCNQDRSDAGALGSLFISLYATKAAHFGSDVYCKANPKQITIPIIGILTPKPTKLKCAIEMAVIQSVIVGLQEAYNAANAQINWVNSAETRGAFRNSQYLLDKECALFDQAVCRPVPFESLGWGTGCDGIDSNCDNVIDDCSEDIVPPLVDISDSLETCSTTTGGKDDKWFKSMEDAERCVESTARIVDDCNTIPTTNVYGRDSCEVAQVLITDVTDQCHNEAPGVSVPVRVDGTKPTVSCRFSIGKSVKKDGKFKNVGFDWAAHDNCQGLPLNVTVNVYANEIDLDLSQMATFIEQGSLKNQTELYLQTDICGGNDCLDDPVHEMKDVRLYTAVVSAVDLAGNLDSATCQLAVTKKEGDLPDDLTLSKQRFLLTSYKTSMIVEGSSTTRFPTSVPTSTTQPSTFPSQVPSAQPSEELSEEPSSKSSQVPTAQTSSLPSAVPSKVPSEQPLMVLPSETPSMALPSPEPSVVPTYYPSPNPTEDEIVLRRALRGQN